MAGFTVHAAHLGASRPVVSLRGELNAAAAQQTQECIESSIARGALVVVDMREVTFMHSSGLRVLALARRQAQHVGATLRLAAPGGKTLRVLRLAGALDSFEIHPSVRAALDAPLGAVEPQPKSDRSAPRAAAGIQTYRAWTCQKAEQSGHAATVSTASATRSGEAGVHETACARRDPIGPVRATAPECHCRAQACCKPRRRSPRAGRRADGEKGLPRRWRHAASGEHERPLAGGLPLL